MTDRKPLSTYSYMTPDDLPDREKVSKVTLFSKRVCPACVMTKIALKKSGVNFVEESIEDASDLTSPLGIRAAPMVIVEFDDDYPSLVWAGMNETWLAWIARR